MFKDILTAIGVTLGIIAVLVGCWFAYWFIAGQSQSNRYEVNTHSQQYQAGIVDAERNRVAAYDVATDPAQQQAIATTFCQVYLELDPPTADLTDAYIRICN